MNDKTDQRLRLTLRQLEVFAATAQLGSTRAAAGQVARSQSAASAALAELEGTLGTQLFDRVGRRLVLNENGQALLPAAIGLLEQASALELLFTSQHPAPLNLASSFTVGEYLLPDLIARWRSLNEHCPVDLAIANTRDVLEAVASFQVNVGFIEGSGSHPDLAIKRWRRDELIVVVAPDHPLASARATPRSLSQAPWILRERGSGTREAADRWLSMHLDEYAIGMELGSNEAVKRAVRAGLGIGCLSRLAVQEAIDSGLLVQVRTPMASLERTLSIVWHRHRRLGTIAQSFVRLCLDTATSVMERTNALPANLPAKT